MLWSVVLFRLLCPATLELGISLVPSLEPVLCEYASEKGEAPAEQAGKAAVADTDGGEKESQGKAEEFAAGWRHPSPCRRTSIS